MPHPLYRSHRSYYIHTVITAHGAGGWSRCWQPQLLTVPAAAHGAGGWSVRAVTGSYSTWVSSYLVSTSQQAGGRAVTASEDPLPSDVSGAAAEDDARSPEQDGVLPTPCRGIFERPHPQDKDKDKDKDVY